MPPLSQATAALDALLSPEGWVHASAEAVEEGDPGRFHALFGRDALITALQVLPHRSDVAVATLRALASRQGRVRDPETEEEPGRILHEDRPVAPAWLVRRGWPVRGGALRYFGSSDATSWFLVLADRVLGGPADGAAGDRAGPAGPAGLAEELRPALAAAADWLEGALAAGDGLVRCGPRRFPGGLAQQGWRDALDPGSDPQGGGIVRLDGSTPAAPLADADSQAVAVAALDALVRLDPGRAEHWRALAARLRGRVGAAYGPEVVALETGAAGEVVVPGAGSQLGWLLWADALDPAATAAVADRLCRPDVLTDLGARTLASTHPAFLAHGYHRGAVWPFDCWLVWGGLRAAGRPQEAERLKAGVLRALEELGRFPELYAVSAAGRPQALPVANRVQAWTVGAVIALDHDWDGRPGPQGR